MNLHGLILVLWVALLALQYRLWFSEGGLSHRSALQEQVEQQKKDNKQLRLRNEKLAAEVVALKSGTEVIEERAREQMGMTKKGETFFMFTGDPQ